MDDRSATVELIRRAGGLCEAARHLTLCLGERVTIQVLCQWRKRGRIAAAKRGAFLMAFNKLKGQPKLPLRWLLGRCT